MEVNVSLGFFFFDKLLCNFLVKIGLFNFDVALDFQIPFSKKKYINQIINQKFWFRIHKLILKSMPRPQLTILLNTFNKQHPDGKCRDIFYAVEGGKKVCQRRKPQEIIKYLRSVDVRNWVNAQEPITSKREIERLAEQTETYIIIYEQTNQNEARILDTFGSGEESVHIVAPC